MTRHYKALKCRVEIEGNRSKVIVLKQKGRQLSITQKDLKELFSDDKNKVEDSIKKILEKNKEEHTLIKSETSYGGTIICNGSKNKPYLRNAHMNPPKQNTTQWERLITLEGDMFEIIDGKYKGKKI